MNVDSIIKLGLLMRALQQHIGQLHSEQFARHYQLNTFTIYRGQGLFHRDFNQSKKIQDGILSFNNFLSTSANCQVSIDFALRIIANCDLVSILFVMTIYFNIQFTLNCIYNPTTSELNFHN
jgi:hypothetical protein